jgi:hypothetical protein
MQRGRERVRRWNLHSSSFSMERSKLSAALPNKCFHKTLETYCNMPTRRVSLFVARSRQLIISMSF